MRRRATKPAPQTPSSDQTASDAGSGTAELPPRSVIDASSTAHPVTPLLKSPTKVNVAIDESATNVPVYWTHCMFDRELAMPCVKVPVESRVAFPSIIAEPLELPPAGLWL